MTLPAHTSMMTGTYPPTHGVRLNEGYRVSQSNATLAKLMEAAGYQTAAFVGGFPLYSKFGLDQGFQTYDDQFPGGESGGEPRNAQQVNRPALSWLEQHHGKPFFLFLHYYDPHFPYVLPPPFAASYADDPYAGEIAYVDSCIGQVLDKLRALGLYDNTLVIVTGDHGEGLGEHGEKEHGYLVYQSTLHVPLIVRVPKDGSSGAEVNQPVSLVDIVPTVLDLIGLGTPPPVQGIDLRGYLEGTGRPERRQPIYSESLWPTLYGCSPLYVIVDGAVEVHPAPKPELYDLSRDGGEKTNLVGRQPQIARRLRTRLAELRKALDAKANPGASTPVDKETRQRLESLGYVGGGAVPAAAGSDSDAELKLEDPKDFLPIFERLQAAIHLFVGKHYREAEKEYLEIVALRPGLPMPHVHLGEIALRERCPADAIPQLSAAISILTESKDASTRLPLAPEELHLLTASHTYLGSALIMEGKLAQAVVELQSALEIDPASAEAHKFLSVALLRQGKADQAIAHLQCPGNQSPRH